MLPIKTILHPTDFSECSEHAWQLACTLAKDHRSRLIVLHVALPPSAVALREIVLATGSDDYKQPLWESLHRLRPENPSIPIGYRLEEGYAAAEILRVAQETQCDLIVMGTHGRTGLGRALLGSVAERVLRKAGCPVVTIRTALPSNHPLEEPVGAEGSS